MNEFNWQRSLQKLRTAHEPERDLWPAISAKILNSPVTEQRSSWLQAALVAGVVLGLGATFASLVRIQQTHSPSTMLVQNSNSSDKSKALALPLPASDYTKLQNPHLVSAASDLDNATIALQQALEQRPDAVFLVSLLNRSYEKRMRLARLGG